MQAPYIPLGRGSGGGTPAPDMEGNETAQEREQRDRTDGDLMRFVLNPKP